MEQSIGYCNDLFNYSRRKSRVVNIGDVPLGGENPIRVQSMTTVDTMDTQGSIEQCIRMVDSGCEYIRITAPSTKEAENLKEIKKGLVLAGYSVPLIADIHYTPNAAEIAACHIEKVRINPGNYADKKKFDIIEYTDSQYQEELDRIRDKFTPLVQICKEYGTAMRIGTNHGSLSDRIMSRYGDSPIGMVESALEFLRICEDLKYYDIVLSMKSSNPKVMVQAYRLLCQKLQEENLQPYPLHLGVTEAGEGEDGRIKSAMGIGTLLEDGLGDTVRVSLTEDPEFEAPVARALVDRYLTRQELKTVETLKNYRYSPFELVKRESNEIQNCGGHQVPRVIIDLSGVNITKKTLSKIGHHYDEPIDKWSVADNGADFVYIGENDLTIDLPFGVQVIQDYNKWSQSPATGAYPLIPFNLLANDQLNKASKNFIYITTDELYEIDLSVIAPNDCIVLKTTHQNVYANLRKAFFFLGNQNITQPVIVKQEYSTSIEHTQLFASTDIGGCLIDGYGDGIWLSNENEENIEAINNLSFGILQASRTRITRAEYISCPSCGRTLFDLQETTAMIRERTDHLKGVKIGIMGCIVNGPGEMADADYGYVGSGKGKITLYKGQEVMKRGVDSVHAVDELIELIKEDGNWINPT